MAKKATTGKSSATKKTMPNQRGPRRHQPRWQLLKAYRRRRTTTSRATARRRRQPLGLFIDVDEAMAAALDRMIADMQAGDISREMAATAALRHWLADAGYLSDDEIEENAPGDGEV